MLRLGLAGDRGDGSLSLSPTNGPRAVSFRGTERTKTEETGRDRNRAQRAATEKGGDREEHKGRGRDSETGRTGGTGTDDGRIPTGIPVVSSSLSLSPLRQKDRKTCDLLTSAAENLIAYIAALSLPSHKRTHSRVYARNRN